MKHISILVFVLSIINSISAIDLEKAFKLSYQYEEQGNISQAIETLTQIYDKESYEINLRLGWLYYQQNLYQKSSEYYQKCIELNSMSIEAKFGIIQTFKSMGYNDKSLKAYQEILKIDNNNTEASYQIASLYYNRKEFRNALKYLEKIIKLYPNNHRIVLLMAWSQMQLSRFGDAKLNFEKVLILNPSDESAQEGLSIIP